VKLVSKTKLDSIYDRYDLAISNNHNFVANGVVVHNTSAHISFDGKNLTFFSGGAEYEKFISLFDKETLLKHFQEIYHGHPIIIFGEAYGGKILKMSHTYGPSLKFVAFDVKIGDSWLNVPTAEKISKNFGLEFVHYVRIPTDLELLNNEMERDSVQGIRNGMGEGHPSEGIILRPIEEMIKNNGSRVIAKHKKAKFCETASVPKIVDPEKLQKLKDADQISSYWVTFMRLEHVADEIRKEILVENIRDFIQGMVDDVKKESVGEVEWSNEVEKSIGRATALCVKNYLKNELEKVGEK